MSGSVSGRRFPALRLPTRPVRETVAVRSPFEDEGSRSTPSVGDRLRGLLGLTVLVVLAGALVALSIGIALLAMAILIATAFN